MPHPLLRQGKALAQAGKIKQAIRCIEKLCQTQPGSADAWFLKAQLYLHQKEFDPAQQALLQLIKIHPEHIEALLNLANIHGHLGQYAQALDYFQRIEAIQPNYHPLYFNRGRLYQRLQKSGEAIMDFQQCLRLVPEDTSSVLALLSLYVEALMHAELEQLLSAMLEDAKAVPQTIFEAGMTLFRAQQKTAALTCFLRVTELSPRHAMAWFNCGIINHNLQDYSAAQTFFERAIDCDPRNADFYASLGRTHKDQHDLDAAWHCCQKALKLDAKNAGALILAANLMTDIGRLDQAIAYYEQAMRLAPENAELGSAYLYCLLHYEGANASMIYQAHVRHAAHYFSLAETRTSVSKDENAPRRIRIGYLSGDFLTHSVSYFIQGILGAHDRSHFEIYCYSFAQAEDGMTAVLKEVSEHWRNISQQDDRQAMKTIGEDAIDILIDLGGHTGQHRLPLMALKPAPIQLSYLGYPATSGLTSIDYRLTDAIADPDSDTVNRTHSETLLRLPNGFLCYTPPALPNIDYRPNPDGQMTLGCFNKLTKLSPTVIVLWSKILHALPGARLLLKSPALGTQLAKKYILESFQKQGINDGQVELLNWSESREEHLKLYNRVDIALDTFPYHGTTTTCEALAMGTPVITLAGDRHASRVGLSVLHHTGLDEFIATTADDYVQRVVDLADNPQRVETYKKNIRNTLLQSTLCNAPLITQNIEAIYRGLIAA